MDELLIRDIESSLHIRDGVYVLTEDGTRKYINVNFPEECSRISPLFSQFKGDSGETLMQGRRFPLQAMPESFELNSVDQISNPKRSNIYERLEYLKGKLFDVGSLVCEKNTPPSHSGFRCSELGNKLSNNIIFAAAKIIKDPHHSVIELIANSIDAYQEERAIGKFGMGFFSLVGWILRDHSNKIEITSFCKEDGAYYAYVATIFMQDSRLSFTVDPLPEGSELTGTRIVLNGKLKVNDQLAFESKIKLMRYSKTSIFGAKGWVCREPKNKDLIVYSTGTSLVIEDYATGIPLEVLISKTLIPSVSTKTILGTRTNQYRVPSMVVERENGGFGILVNGVLVYYASSTSNYDIILSLPANVRILTSRDDVVLEEELQYAFDELFDRCVETRCVFELQTLAEQYMSFTNNENRGLMDKWFKLAETRYEDVLVMGDLGILPGLIKSKVQNLEAVYPAIIESLSTFKYEGELYFGKKVYVVDIPFPDDPEIYVPDLVVISSALVGKLGKWWIHALTLRYFKAGKLKIVNGPSEQQSPEESYFYYVAGLISSLSTFARFVDTTNIDVERLLNFIFNNLGSQRFVRLCKAFALELSTYRPLNVYGTVYERFWFQSLYVPLYQAFSSGTAITKDLFEKALDLEVDLLIDTFKHRIIQPITYWMPQNGCFTGQVLGYITSYAILIERAKTAVELYWLYRIFELSKYELNSTEQVDLILSRIRDRNPGPETVVSHYMGLQSIEDTILIDEVTWIFGSHPPGRYVEPENKGTEIKASELTRYIFNHSIDDVRNILETTDYVHPSIGELQTINIAINYLSSQNWIDSVVDECIRNAIEAFYWAKEVNGYVDVDISLTQDEGRYGLCISFFDTSGMDFESFVAIGVPFFSTKNQSGGGFFKVYRHASRVEVTTKKEEGLKWTDFPLNFPPTDVRKIFSREENAPKGTRVSVYLDNVTSDMAKAHSRVRFRLEKIYSQCELSGFDVRFQGTSVIKQRRFIESFRDESGVIASFNYIPDDVPSYILIGGIPFAPLSNYYGKREYLPKHIIFNVKDESVMKTKTFKEMVGKAIAYEGFMVSFAGGRQFDPNINFQYEADSVLPANTFLEPSKIYQQPERWAECEFFPGVSIQTLIWRAVEATGDGNWDPSLSSVLIPQTHPEYANLLAYALNQWMAPKNRLRSREDYGEPDPELTIIANSAVQAYWDAGKSLGIFGFKGEVTGVGYGGHSRSFFDRKTKTVHLFDLGELEILQYVSFIASDSVLSEPPLFSEAGALAHELEHARRHENTSMFDPPHSPFTGPLWSSDRTVTRSFVECYVAIFRKIMSEGNFRTRFKEALFENGYFTKVDDADYFNRRIVENPVLPR